MKSIFCQTRRVRTHEFAVKYENGSLNCAFGGGRVSWTMQALTFMSEEHSTSSSQLSPRLTGLLPSFPIPYVRGGTAGGGEGFGVSGGRVR